MPMHRLRWTDPAPAEAMRGAVAIGNFDGVHRGHHNLLRTLSRWARRVSGPAVAVTFDPPPVALLNPQALKPPLTEIPDRAALLHDAGADHVLVLTVEPSLLALSAPAFIEEVLQRQLEARAIVEGSNFRFGKDREGDCDLLNTLEHRCNINFEAVPVDGISSSRIRSALVEGNAALACELLGRPYRMRGQVVEGAKRGRTIGVPTANLADVRTVIPAPGVYAGCVTLDGAARAAAINIGPNPTFGDALQKIEVHIMDFNGELYGRTLEVDLFKRLRDVQTFPTVGDLLRQVERDVTAARQCFQDRPA